MLGVVWATSATIARVLLLQHLPLLLQRQVVEHVLSTDQLAEHASCSVLLREVSKTVVLTVLLTRHDCFPPRLRPELLPGVAALASGMPNIYVLPYGT